MKFENRHFDDARLGELLTKYGHAEPPPGLERRVLARITVERERSAVQGWGWRLAAAMLALGAIAALGLFMMRKAGSTAGTSAPEASIANTGPRILPPAMSAAEPNSKPKPAIHNRFQQSAARKPIEPRLEQFPSPAPLSEQEEMLIRYVRERHHEAVMVARARAELRRQELAQLAKESPSSEQLQDLQP